MVYNVIISLRFKSLIPNYISNRQKDIENINKLAENNDYEQIYEIGHTMKGSGGMYGFDEISKIGNILEMLAYNKEKDKILFYSNELYNYLLNLNITYKD